jgi:ubiquinone/menaquinone biosynthesis C-methylase UbiE
MYNTESYRKHQEFIDSKSDETYIKELYNHDSPIHHYNQLFFEFLNPFVEPASAWLTVGDSTGIDAAYLKKQGGVATASDLSTKTLERVFAQQLIDGFSVQNVEQLSYPNNSFDYVCCKEAYHHFPRPAIGFYEMLRVARKGVVIIEPSDINSAYPVLLLVRNILDRISPKLLRKIWKNQYSYEIVGNFVYKISFREFEKMAAALDLPCVAYAGFNTMMGARWDAQFVQKLKRFFVDMLCKISLLPYQHLSLVVFKEKPSETTRKKMQQMGYKIYDLPKNPYN